MTIVNLLFVPLATALLLAVQGGPSKAQPVVVGTDVHLAEMCNAPNVHCLFTAKGISVDGTGIEKVEHYAAGNSVWMHSSKPGNGTAVGCDGSSVSWSFNGGVSQYHGGNASVNPHMLGFFLQYPRWVIANGGLSLADTPDADVGLYCG